MIKTKQKGIILLLSLLLLILILFHINIPCPINLVTGLHCPGCGLTRMLKAICEFNFYQAFRYNMLLFILMPFFSFYFLNTIYCIITSQKDKMFYKKIPNIVIYILITVSLLFGILRNIFPILAPTTL